MADRRRPVIIRRAPERDRNREIALANKLSILYHRVIACGHNIGTVFTGIHPTLSYQIYRDLYNDLLHDNAQIATNLSNYIVGLRNGNASINSQFQADMVGFLRPLISFLKNLRQSKINTPEFGAWDLLLSGMIGLYELIIESLDPFHETFANSNPNDDTSYEKKINLAVIMNVPKVLGQRVN
jgi:hypothetical protein